jgi:hypothetical protein
MLACWSRAFYQSIMGVFGCRPKVPGQILAVPKQIGSGLVEDQILVLSKKFGPANRILRQFYAKFREDESATQIWPAQIPARRVSMWSCGPKKPSQNQAAGQCWAKPKLGSNLDVWFVKKMPNFGLVVQ